MAKKKAKEPTLVENYNSLKNMITGAEDDVIKKAEKNNYSAGQRFRKIIKQSKSLLSILRKQSLEKK